MPYRRCSQKLGQIRRLAANEKLFYLKYSVLSPTAHFAVRVDIWGDKYQRVDRGLESGRHIDSKYIIMPMFGRELFKNMVFFSDTSTFTELEFI